VIADDRILPVAKVRAASPVRVISIQTINDQTHSTETTQLSRSGVEEFLWLHAFAVPQVELESSFGLYKNRGLDIMVVGVVTIASQRYVRNWQLRDIFSVALVSM